jgi:cytochrome oxidase Cu insertion factor (SCO1/SenC/PrrC family)
MKLKIACASLLLAACVTCTERARSPVAAGEPKARSSPVQVGEVAPDFTLEDQNGRKVTLSAARGQAPVVLVFYRGHW